MTKLFRVCSVVILSSVMAAGCAAHGVRIAELKDRPDKYDRKTVSIEGVVTGSYGAGFLGRLAPIQGYRIDDGSGEITVISRSSRVIPQTGARVRVKGKVNELGSFGGRSIGLDGKPGLVGHQRFERLELRRQQGGGHVVPPAGTDPPLEGRLGHEQMHEPD